ncbi:MAG: U32 family peptidase C-terminal domain-containing protein [Oscillospiraceae bacterium]
MSATGTIPPDFYGQPGQFYEDARYIRDWQICAVVTDCTPEGLATLSLRNKFACGDQVEVVGPDTKPFTMTAPMMTDSQGLPLTELENAADGVYHAAAPSGAAYELCPATRWTWAEDKCVEAGIRLAGFPLLI